MDEDGLRVALARIAWRPELRSSRLIKRTLDQIAHLGVVKLVGQSKRGTAADVVE